MQNRLPPGPRDWICGISEFQRLKRDLLGRYLAWHETYGDMVYTRFGPIRYYAAFHPDQIREVLVTKAKAFHHTPAVRRVLSQWNGNGLLMSEGEFWLRQRRLIQQAFRPARLAGYGEAMVNHTLQLAERWRNSCADSGRLDMNRAMTDLTLAIIAETMFGADVSESAADIGRAVAILSEVAVAEMQAPVRLPDWLPTAAKRQKRWAIQFLDETVWSFVRERRASGEDRGDLLSMLLLAVDDEGDGGRMTDQQARDECMTLFLAGHDTSASGLVWTLYNIARHPEVAEKLASEVDRVLGERPPRHDDLAELQYAEMVVKETLRLFPPAIGVFQRRAKQAVEIGGYTIPKGSLLQLLSFVTHRDPRWFAEPEQFRPERFSPAESDGRPQFAYFPFGGGPRVCIGNSFAMAEMTLVVATLAQHFRFDVPSGQNEVELEAHMSLRPKGGLPLVVTPRTSSVEKLPA